MVCNADASVRAPSGVAHAEPQYAEITLTESKSIQEVSVQIDAPSKPKHGEHNGERPPQSIWLLAYCFLGIMVSFTLNGIVLEKMTTHRVLGEMSLTFVFCFFYSVVALFLRHINKEKPSTMPQSKLMIVGLLAFGSTISSMIALRYVTFITRILGKSCKSIPVMIVGLFLGKSYAFKKYISCFFAAVGMVFMGELPTFVEKAIPSLPNLILLSATGALGQAFIFFTISKFGALTTSIIGTCRKVLSIVLSVILFGHVLSVEQFIGLTIAFIGIGLNWAKCAWCSRKPGQTERPKDIEAEELLEASDETVSSEEEDEELLPASAAQDLVSMQPREEILHSKDVERGLELVNMWHRHHDHLTPGSAPTAAQAV
ncbi:hypothetical protein ATCC90586_002543 [Pythium insidiosum]|nr:hypothetical protein ATCC90586_002543 [Pythium insidiosum]